MGSRRPDPSKPRNVICKMHYTQAKDKIMYAARQNKNAQYEGEQLIFFQDLSKFTLDRRRALKPLLEQLIKKNLQYRWKYPFQLQVQHEGLTEIFRDLEDLPEFLISLQIPEVKLPDWPNTYMKTFKKNINGPKKMKGEGRD